MTTFWNSKFILSQLILIQQLHEKDWIKSIYIEYLTYIFLWPLGLMFMVHKTLPNKKNLKK
jgi:hypothetical protein